MLSSPCFYAETIGYKIQTVFFKTTLKNITPKILPLSHFKATKLFIRAIFLKIVTCEFFGFSRLPLNTKKAPHLRN